LHFSKSFSYSILNFFYSEYNNFHYLLLSNFVYASKEKEEGRQEKEGHKEEGDKEKKEIVHRTFS